MSSRVWFCVSYHQRVVTALYSARYTPPFSGGTERHVTFCRECICLFEDTGLIRDVLPLARD